VAYAATSNIDPTDKWAWSKNVGWVNFASVGYEGVTVYADHLEGYAWAENVGRMRFKGAEDQAYNVVTIGGYTEPLSLLASSWLWVLLAAMVVAGAIAAAALKRRAA
jgi:hypothetical protein